MTTLVTENNDCPIPLDMDIQKHWKDHDMVTDAMVGWLHKSFDCKDYQDLRDICASRHLHLFKKPIPEGKCCWEKVDMRPGAFQLLGAELVARNTMYTDKNGRNAYYFNSVNSQEECDKYVDMDATVCAMLGTTTKVSD
jgi:hypothetical protein